MRRIRPLPLICWLGLWLGLLSPAEAKENWAKVESTYFTLYAEGDLSDAREWASSFEQFRRYVNEFIHVSPTQLQPLTIILFRSSSEMLRYVPANKNGKRPTELASITKTLSSGTIIITCRNWDDRDTRESFYGAGTYWMLSGFKYSGPDWFQAGLAETFKTFDVTGDEFRAGMAPEGTVYYLSQNTLMPLPRLFGLTFGELDFRGDKRTTLFFAESWALVHRFIFGREKERGGTTRAPQLADFVEALQQGEPAEAAFKRVFGTDYDGMIRQLESYVSSGHYAIAAGRFDRTRMAADLKVRRTTDAETEIIRGSAYLAAEQNEEARRHFLLAGTLPGGELAAEDALGDMESGSNNEHEAATHYTRAIELKTRNYRAFYFLAHQFVRDASGDLAPLPRFEARQARVAASRFEQAINLYPSYVPSYEGLALLMPSLDAFSDDDRQFLELGLKVAPDNGLVEAGLGVWEIRNHREEKGQQRLRELLAEGRGTTGLAKAMAQDITAGQAAGRGLSAARQLMEAGKTDEAGELVEKLLKDASDETLRASLVSLREEIGQLDLVLQAERLAGDQQWEAAGSIAQGALDGGLPAPLQQRAEAVLARVKAKK